ncbi:MAG: hypothetical protein M3Y70_08365 [Pseudomonadota bacterium]|nr:hypothetical protein [Pseudomonadota bacterium]
MGKHWIIALALLGLAACSDKPAEAPVDAPAAPAAAEPAAPPPEAAAAPVANDAALQAGDVDAYLLGMQKEVQLLRDEYAKIEKARADDDSDAETAALFAMTANAIDEAGAQAAGLPAKRYRNVKERVDEVESKLAMLDGLAAMEGDTTALQSQVGDPYSGLDDEVTQALKARQGDIAALRGEAIGLRLKAAGG